MFFLISEFSQFSMVLGWSGYQFQLLGSISCPGLPPDRSGVEFYVYSDFPLHIVFICLSVQRAFSIQKMVPRQWESNRQIRDIHKYMGKLWASLLNDQTFRIFKTRLDSEKMFADAKIKPSPQAPAYYSYEHTLSCYICSTSHLVGYRFRVQIR